MNALARRRSIASLVVGVACVLSTALWAGGTGFGDDDDFNADEGRAYFGFVKDTNGSTMPDAKVTLTVKDRGGVVTRTDALGAYKVPGFGKEIDPKDVQVSCDKQGYKQVRINQRIPPPTADLKIPIETECILQRSYNEMRNGAGMSLAGLFAALAAMVTAAPAAAQTAVDLQLVLAVDASGSVDQYRFELQKRGYVAAFRHPRVLEAIRSGPSQSIAVIMMQWTGPALQVPVTGWSRIGDEESAAAFAAAIERAPRRLFGGGTSISGAIDFSTALFSRSPYRGNRRVVDVSGDGSNNRGRPVTLARDEAVAAGIGINGLPILALERDLDRYYQDHVIGGPGAFVIAAKDFETFGEAILKKLVTEIAANDRRRTARRE